MTSTFGGSESGSTAKPWFCEVMVTLPVVRSLHRLVAAAMAELELEGLSAKRVAEHLVAEADAEDRLLADEAAHRLRGRR